MAGSSRYGTKAECSVSQATHIKNFNNLYSSKIKHDDANGMLLSEAVKMKASGDLFPDPWSENHDEEQSISALFRQKSEDLDESRKRFMKYLSEDQRASIAKSANTTQTVLNIVDSASFDWCKRSESGSAIVTGFKKKFHQVCKSLDQHKDLFSVLPKDSEYVSVFYGAFNSIIAASVMHQAMATGLPKIVDELNAIIKDVAAKMKLYPKASQQMKRVMTELFTRIFDLLGKLMKWYTKHNSHWKIMKKDCYNDFESALRDIRNWVDIVTKGAWNNFVLEMRRAREEDRDAREVERNARERFREDMHKVAKIAEDYYEMQQDTARQQAAQLKLLTPEAFADIFMRKFFPLFDKVGAGQTYIMASMAETISQETTNAAALGSLASQPFSAQGGNAIDQALDTAADDSVDFLDLSTDDQTLTALLRTKEEVERHLQILDEWYPDGHVHPVYLGQDLMSRSSLHESIASRLLQFINGTESEVICLQLPYDSQKGSSGSKIASHVVSTAHEVDYPIISYFCTLPTTVPDGRTTQTTALCEMMACLTRQLVMLLPDSLPEPSSVALTAARFDDLDGTLRTWNLMLSLFDDLLSLVDRNLFVVIHGMQCLNSQYTTSPIQDFLAVLRKRLDSNKNAIQKIKILLVMEGQSFAVVPWLQRGEYALYHGDRRLTR